MKMGIGDWGYPLLTVLGKPTLSDKSSPRYAWALVLTRDNVL